MADMDPSSESLENAYRRSNGMDYSNSIFTRYPHVSCHSQYLLLLDAAYLLVCSFSSLAASH